MELRLDIRNESRHRIVVRRDVLQRLGERICQGEGIAGEAELSVLYCSDATIRDLNRDYRHKDEATDVLSFEQEGPGAMRVLGDVVISLDTVARRCNNDTNAMRGEVRLLFCHGLLHLLGYDHHTRRERERMAAKQAEYLNLPVDAAWPVEA